MIIKKIFLLLLITTTAATTTTVYVFEEGLRPFQNDLVILSRWDGDNYMLCAMEHRLQTRRIVAYSAH